MCTKSHKDHRFMRAASNKRLHEHAAASRAATTQQTNAETDSDIFPDYAATFSDHTQAHKKTRQPVWRPCSGSQGATWLVCFLTAASESYLRGESLEWAGVGPEDKHRCNPVF